MFKDDVFRLFCGYFLRFLLLGCSALNFIGFPIGRTLTFNPVNFNRSPKNT